MSDRNFATIKHIAYTTTGINLSDHKKNMIYGRLARRLRRIGLSDFDQYCALLEDSESPEMREFINAITTNLTSFFREGHHFEHLKNEVIPRLIREDTGQKRIRIWSAGCSTGEEAYSIAMVLSSITALENWDVKVLATDLDTNVLQKASSGVYAIERAESIPSEYRRFFQLEKSGERVQVKQRIRDLVVFKPLNLLHGWPMKGPFDVIFCRNVVIYFDAKTQRVLFDRYANILIPCGNLFIGHSESLHNITKRFQPIGRTIYRKTS